MTATIPVRYGTNPTHVWSVRDEFGEFAVIVADTFEDARAWAVELLADRDGECDHGGDPAGADGCDCELTDDGHHVWTVHLEIAESRLPLDKFELAHGEWVGETRRGEGRWSCPA